MVSAPDGQQSANSFQFGEAVGESGLRNRSTVFSARRALSAVSENSLEYE